MLKKNYLKELQLGQACSIGSRSPDVKKIQEWLNLWSYQLPGLARLVTDGDFGPATQAAVIAFRRTTNLPAKAPAGTVDAALFAKLTAPLYQAFNFVPALPLSGREAIIACGKQHLAAGARELPANTGPWVRSYMGGQEGNSWPWCVGFVQTIFDQALGFSGQKYTDFMPATYSCDVLGEFARKHGSLVRNQVLRTSAELVSPGDLFLVSRTSTDWTHIGIIEKVTGDVFYTLEGNTNAAGSREGTSVLRRQRNFRREPLDVIRFPQLDHA